MNYDKQNRLKDKRHIFHDVSSVNSNSLSISKKKLSEKAEVTERRSQ